MLHLLAKQSHHDQYRHHQNKMIYQNCIDLEKAREALTAPNDARALTLYEKAVKRNLNNIMVLQEAALAFAQHYDLRKAHNCISRILAHGKGQDGRILLLAGQLWRASYRPEQAIISLSAAVKLPNPPSKAHLELADLFERSGQIEKSLECAEHALHAEPNNHITQCVKARLLNRMGEADQAEILLSKIISDHSCPPSEKAYSHNLRANLLDQLGQYDQAFQQLLASKKILLSQPETPRLIQEAETEYAILSHAIQHTQKHHLQSWKQQRQTSQLNNLLLTGNPRSGTTLIEKILDAHSAIISADEYNPLTSNILPKLLSNHLDEQGYFDSKILDAISPQHKRKAAVHYRRTLESAMREKINSRLLIDKNPGLTGHIPALLSILPNTQILFALRNPLDVSLSCFFQWLPLNTASINYLNLKTTCSRTAQELKFWAQLRDILPPASWKETRYENTVQDPHQEAQDILSWMGLPWEENIKDYKKHLNQRGVNSPTYEAVSKPVYTTAINRWKHYEKHFQESEAILAPAIQTFDY